MALITTLDRPAPTKAPVLDDEALARLVIGDGDFDRTVANACACDAGDDNPY